MRSVMGRREMLLGLFSDVKNPLGASPTFELRRNINVIHLANVQMRLQRTDGDVVGGKQKAT